MATALLGPEQGGAKDVRATAELGLAALAGKRELLLEFIASCEK
jgi:hypothetical protein